MKSIKFQDLHEDYKNLVQHANRGLKMSYAPYSKFNVSASVQLEDGSLLHGANQENAAYPMCLCAERVALAYASMHRPNNKIVRMAICTTAKLETKQIPAAPCGACRQVISEFEQRQSSQIEIILIGKDQHCWIFEGIDALLPHSFNIDFLR